MTQAISKQTLMYNGQVAKPPRGDRRVGHEHNGLISISTDEADLVCDEGVVTNSFQVGRLQSNSSRPRADGGLPGVGCGGEALEFRQLAKRVEVGVLRQQIDAEALA